MKDHVEGNSELLPGMAPLILKMDPQVGLYVCADHAITELLVRGLDDEQVRYTLNPPLAAHLVTPGMRLLAFGSQHPLGILDLIHDCDLAAEVDPAVVLAETTYASPVDQLVKAGEIDLAGEPASYADLGIGREHVPELIRMATDEALHTGPVGSHIYWGPVRAWRALGELRAEEAVGPLLDLLCRIDDEQDDWVREEIPEVLAEIGPVALDPLAEYLANTAHGEWARLAAAQGIATIATYHPDQRPACVARLSAQLERFANQSDVFNGYIVSNLMDLAAVEAAPIMQQAFAAGAVDESIAGDWEDVAIELGLKTHREHPRKPNWLTELSNQWQAARAVREALQALPEEPVADEDSEPPRAAPMPGRNQTCPCGSGKKYKKCCGRHEEV